MRFLTPEQAWKEMMSSVEDLTSENYHTEAEFLSDQADKMKAAADQGVVIGYFSWSLSDVGGIKECILVRQ